MEKNSQKSFNILIYNHRAIGPKSGGVVTLRSERREVPVQGVPDRSKLWRFKYLQENEKKIQK